MTWFTDLTGIADDRPAAVRAGIDTDRMTLASRANGRMDAGRLAIPSLAELRDATPGPGAGRLAAQHATEKE